MQIAQLALKHRENKNQKQRIVVFVGSPLEDSRDSLVKLGKRLRKNNVLIDVVTVGEEGMGNDEKIGAMVEAAGGNESLVRVPIAGRVADSRKGTWFRSPLVLVSYPISSGSLQYYTMQIGRWMAVWTEMISTRAWTQSWQWLVSPKSLKQNHANDAIGAPDVIARGRAECTTSSAGRSWTIDSCRCSSPTTRIRFLRLCARHRFRSTRRGQGSTCRCGGDWRRRRRDDGRGTRRR